MTKNILCVLLMYVLSSSAMAQKFTDVQWNQGYALNGDSTFFLFDASLYGQENIEKVVVTGSFRGWSHDLDDSAWILESTNEQNRFILGFENPKQEVVGIAAEFKFRVNAGDWLDPHSKAENTSGGNLVFMYGLTPPTLTADLRGETSIWMNLEGVERSLRPEDYRLTNVDGEELPIAAILPNTSTQTLVVPGVALDKKKVYYISYPSYKLSSVCSFDGWFRELYSDKPLGANVSEDRTKTDIRLFAPRATKVELCFYTSSDDESPSQVHLMEVDDQGVWEYSEDTDLKGTWYDFRVYGFDEKGNHFYETIQETVSDPYARVNDEAWGKSRVWYATEPASPLKDGIPPLSEVIAYEVHVQDFTDLLPVKPEEKGTFVAMSKPGLRNNQGEKIGFDYLVDLGINTVHLMPVQEYLHYPEEWWKPAFQDDPFMQKHGIAEENYQWGYRTTHAMAVETRYRVKGTEAGAEREQFRDLVQAFHDKGIAVIIDIVPNHTGENMDGVNYYLNFNGIDKQYYYRTKNLEHIGEYGNEVKTENRPMVQRWLIDQCLYYINEFGIDGFRIDLAGQIDEQTLIAIKKAIGEDKILYGEPWIASNDPNYERNPDWDWYKIDSPITYFNDDARNAFKGGAFFDVTNPQPYKERGFSGGFTEERANVVRALQNIFPEEKSPHSGINYLDIHDNWALADQFAVENWNGLTGVLEDRVKIAAVLLYTSQGPIVTHGGTEFLRSKAHAELKETVKEMTNGTKVYIHGKRDTYNMRVANHFLWENVGLNKGEKGAKVNHENMRQFWKGLNLFRTSEFGDVFHNKSAIPEGFYQFILPENESLLGYIVDNSVMVLINTGETEETFESVSFPEGKWKLIGNSSTFNHIKGVKDDRKFRKIKGGSTYSFTLEPTDVKVWLRTK